MGKSKWVIIIGFCGAVFVQGLYFNEQILFALALICGFLIYSYRVEKLIRIPKDGVFYFLLFYVVCHLVGYVTFVEKGMLVFSLARSILYLMAYVLVYQMYDANFEKKFRACFAYTMLAAGVMSSLSYFFELLPSKKYVIDARLAGPLQYANTMGILLIVAMICFLSIKMKASFRLLGLVGYCVAIVLTMSRGSVIIGGLILIIYLVTTKTPLVTYVSLFSSIIIASLFVYLMDAGASLQRIGESDIGASEFQTRLLYYTDALSMIREHLLGYGPYGYYYAQRAFQSGSIYYTKLVHSSILQISLELGIVAGVGTLIFAVYVLFFRKYDWTNRLVVIAILGHSLMDVDLAYGFVWLLLLVFIQQSDGSRRRSYTLELGSSKGPWVVYISLVVVAVTALYFFRVTLLYDQKEYEEVLRLYPYHTEALRKSLPNIKDQSLGVERAEALRQRNPYVVEAYELLYNDSIKSENLEDALFYARSLVKVNVLQITRYETLAKTLRIIGQKSLLKGDSLIAISYFEEVLLMPERLEELAKEKNTHYNVRHVPYLGMTPVLKQEYEVAEAWMKKIKSNSLEVVNERE